jgi:xanthine dehydrogenase YagT iron-sulfur-binding subunit
MSERPTPLTRRGLFRSLGTATLVAGCVKQDPPTQKPTADAPDLDGSFGATAAPLSFVLDGTEVKVEAEARTTLLQLLRLDLDRTGTKLVCDRGACGACMVLVDGVARNSCMLLAHDVAGCEVTTVAGLAADGELSALQRAFVEHDAMQCGFCTSGMLISSSALLRKRSGQPLERADVEQAIAGNLCRCGTYPHVVDAVMAVANGSEGRQHTAELIRATTGSAQGGA